MSSIPKTPIKGDPETRRFNEAVRQALVDIENKALTVQDLRSSGFWDNNNITVPGTDTTVAAAPTVPVNLTASGVFQNIILEWDVTPYTGHALTRVYRSTTNLFADAVVIANVNAEVFADPVGPGKSYYYWVTNVNAKGQESAPNQTLGTLGTTLQDTAYLLQLLSNSITESQLFQSLGDRINLIDATGTGLVDRVNDLEDIYGDTVSAAQSAADAALSASQAIDAKAQAIIAKGQAVLAAGDAVTAKDDAVLAKTDAQSASGTATAAASTAQNYSSQASTSASLAAGYASAASDSKIAAETAEANAETAASAAVTSAQNAESYSDTAQSAATASNASKVAAEAAKGSAETAAQSAVSSSQLASSYADDAGAAATAAQSSAVSASASAATATTKAGIATDAAASAQISADGASQSASAAQTSKIAAETAASSATIARNEAVSAKDTATTKAAEASQSATLAAQSKLDAGNSATAAAGSASTAATKATEAGTSATASNTAKVAAESARDNAAASASAAATSASTAATKATEAGQYATSASTSANTASTAAADALAYKNSAATSATDAEGYAIASAQDYSAVNARLNNAGGTGVTVEQSLSANASSIGGLQGQYTVKIDNNGYVSGFGLASTSTTSTPTSNFIVRADRFAIASPSGPGITPKIPFIVVTTPTVENGVTIQPGVYIDNATIKDASITSAKIQSVVADNITTGRLKVAIGLDGDLNVGTGRIIFDTGSYMKVQGLGFGSTNQFIEWFGPKLASFSQCTEANAITYVKRDGSAYFGGSLSAGILKNAARTTGIGATEVIEVGPFGSNGGTRTVVLSYDYLYFWQITNAVSYSGTPSAQIVLERANGSGGWTTLSTLNVTGSVTGEDGFGSSEPGFIRIEMGGSTTFTDTSGGLSCTYRGRMVFRTLPSVSSSGIGFPTVTQSVGVISTE